MITPTPAPSLPAPTPRSRRRTREGDETEVCLGLSTTGGEPQEVGEFPVVALGVCETLKVQEDERHLEGAPFTDDTPHLGVRAVSDEFLSSSLLLHHEVHHTEGAFDLGILGEQVDASPHSRGRRACVVEVPARCRAMAGGQVGQFLFLTTDPVVVAPDERHERVAQGLMVGASPS
ncbi:hypothetical protein NKG05_11090 [Oerskovia sp. M15]